MSEIQWNEAGRERRRKKYIWRIGMIVSSILLLLALSFFAIATILSRHFTKNYPGPETITEALSNGAVIQMEYLTPNRFSRPQIQLKNVKEIVIHYTANPGTSAEQNRSYFQGLAKKHTTYASSHFIIGLEGEVIQCIPLNEISYASNDRNKDTIAIECCHPDETGKFEEATYASMVSLTAALCVEFDLEAANIIRHYDISGKLCPLYFVDYEDAWDQFKSDVFVEIDKLRMDSHDSVKQ